MNVQDLINESVSTNSIIHESYTDAKEEQLAVEADDYTSYCNGQEMVYEFWGTRKDGEEWRVHLDKEICS
jgi:hypothetical protein